MSNIYTLQGATIEIGDIGQILYTPETSDYTIHNNTLTLELDLRNWLFKGMIATNNDPTTFNGFSPDMVMSPDFDPKAKVVGLMLKNLFSAYTDRVYGEVYDGITLTTTKIDQSVLWFPLAHEMRENILAEYVYEKLVSANFDIYKVRDLLHNNEGFFGLVQMEELFDKLLNANVFDEIDHSNGSRYYTLRESALPRNNDTTPEQRFKLSQAVTIRIPYGTSDGRNYFKDGLQSGGDVTVATQDGEFHEFKFNFVIRDARDSSDPEGVNKHTVQSINVASTWAMQSTNANPSDTLPSNP